MKRKHLLSIIPLLKNFPDFYYRNNLRKMLVSISYDSLSRNALRCGIDAKVRSKNECASKKREKIHQLIRKAGISERNTRFWRMKSISHVAWHTDNTD